MPSAAVSRGTVLLAALAAAHAASLSPLQSKAVNLLSDIKGAVADKERVVSNAERAVTNAKARIDQADFLASVVSLNKSADSGDDVGVLVSVVADPAQSVLVGGVPAGNILCFYDDAGVVVGLQQGNVSVCSTTGKYVTVKLATGYVSGLKVARSSGSAIGWLEFEVTTPGNAVPALYPCGSAPATKPRPVIPAGHALVSVDASCASSGTGRRKRSLLDAQGGALSTLRVVAAPVTDATPMPGGQLAVKRVQQTCDGKNTYQVVAASDVSLTVCAPISPPCDVATSYTRIQPNATTDRVCAPLSECDPGHTYQVSPSTATSDRVCGPVSPPCVAGVTWESQAPDALNDRICSRVSAPCQPGITWESRAPTALADRVCSRVSVCDGVATFMTKAATNTSDAVCSPIAPACDLAVSYESVSPNKTTNRECEPLSPPCDGVYTWEAVRPTARSDRRCANITAPCDGVNTFETVSPSPLRNRQCLPVSAPCVAGTTWQKVAPSPLNDRVCVPVSPPCSNNTFESSAPTPLADRVCKTLSPTCDGVDRFTVKNQTATSDRVCKSTTICDGTTNYQTAPPTVYSDTICSPVSPPCANGTWQVEAPTPTSDRVCQPWTKCNSTQYVLTNGTSMVDVQCANITQCELGTTYQTQAATPFSDTVCTPTKPCLSNQKITSNATLDRDFECGWPDNSRQCNYMNSSQFVFHDRGDITFNDVVVCVNQETAPGYYIKGNCSCSGCNGKIRDQFPPDSPQPYVLDFYKDNNNGASCDVRLYDPYDNEKGLVHIYQQYESDDSHTLEVSDGGPNKVKFKNLDFPSVQDKPSSLGGMDFRGQHSERLMERPGILEIFGQSCANKTNVIYDVELLGSPYNFTEVLGRPDTQTTSVAYLTGYTVNCRDTAQTVSFQAAAQRTRTFAMQDTTTNSDKFSVGVDMKIRQSFFTELTVKLGYEYQWTHSLSNTKTDTVTETTTFTIQDQAPPRSNCSVRGTVETGILTWSQDVRYSYMDACTRTPQKLNATLNIAASGVIMSDSMAKITFDQCSPPSFDLCRPSNVVPPPNRKCSTNVACSASGFDGNCCPKDDGTYMSCCAQAVAHPECLSVDYIRPTDAICPSSTNVYSKCCTTNAPK